MNPNIFFISDPLKKEFFFKCALKSQKNETKKKQQDSLINESNQ